MGDGAVGRGLAVALSLSGRDVFLAGPPGTPRGTIELEARGFYSGTVSVRSGPVRNAPDHLPVVCALKAYAIPEALGSIRACRPGSVVSVTNGLELEELWGGLETEPAVLTAGFRLEGPAVLTSDGGVFMEKDGHAEKILSGTPIPAHPVHGIGKMVNAKWLVNSVINPLGALTGLRNNALRQSGMGPLIDALVTELAGAVPDDSLEPARAMLNALLAESGNYCSMLQDLKAGRPTELPWLTGIAERRLPGRCPTASTLCALVRAKTLSCRRHAGDIQGEGYSSSSSPM